jgi:hypothetical protein
MHGEGIFTYGYGTGCIFIVLIVFFICLFTIVLPTVLILYGLNMTSSSKEPNHLLSEEEQHQVDEKNDEDDFW